MPAPRPLACLLVEDSEDDASLLFHHLAGGGYELNALRVETAPTMSAALKERTWDLVISDHSLPHFDAPSALGVLKESGLDLPFIVVTGTIGEERAVELMKGGAHDFVLKGNMKRLIPAIERELREAVNRKAKREMEGERARVLEQLRKNIELRDEFLAVASHELSTPLTPMRLQTRLLRQTLDQEPATAETLQSARKMVAVSERQLDRLVHLVEQMRDDSRIRAGRLILSLRETDLTALVAGAIEGIKEKLTSADCHAELEAQPGVFASVDATRIADVLANLLSNSLTYAPGKPIHIGLRSDGTQATITVRDFGIGIDPKDQARIFERFERAVPVKHFGGLGLGLYLSREILAAHGGSIEVESEPGSGATFKITLPLRPGAGKESS